VNPLTVGIDVGGTYTDLITRYGDETIIIKVPSTPREPHVGILRALAALRERGHEIGSLVHGVTLATNAVLTRSGGPVALVATQGFSDVLEMRRRDRPNTYGLHGQFDPLVPRNLRFDAVERTNADGAVLTPADLGPVIEALRALPEPPAAIAVCFLHSFRNPANELAARDQLVAAGFPLVSLSHEVSPEIGEFERMSTVVVNAFLQPVMSRYIGLLREGCAEVGDIDELLILHGNGGAMTLGLASAFPVRTVMSGPAGGVLAAQRIGAESGFPNLLTFDVGGTSTDAAVIVDGHAAHAPRVTVGFGVPIRTAMTEIITIGAGGGSIATIDRGGLLQIGPESAGADPGPACYGRGGTHPTLTDAHLVLGRINAARPIGDGTIARLDLDAARDAIVREIATPLGVSVEEAAHAMLEVANQKMAGALRLISVERGHDPGSFVLVAFGGGGPLHACALARAVGTSAALVPPHPGTTSALGCLMADFRGERTATLRIELGDLTDEQLAKAMEAETAILRDELEESGVVAGTETLVEYGCSASFRGQAHTFDVNLGAELPTLAGLGQEFHAVYERQIGAVPVGGAIVVHDLRVSVRVPRGGLLPTSSSRGQDVDAVRAVWFEGRWWDTPVLSRHALTTGQVMTGPAIVEQEDTTFVLDPGFEAVRDRQGNLVVRKTSGPR
jgi:N-methylhydantoinase A